MKVTVNGMITVALEQRRGVSKAGREWVMQDYGIQPHGEEDIVVFQVLGEENINNYGLKVGSSVSVTLEIKSRNYNGKYYPSITAIQCYAQAQQQAPRQAPEPTMPSESNSTGVDALPF